MKKLLLLLIVFVTVSCSTNDELNGNPTHSLKLPSKLEVIKDYVNDDRYYVTTYDYKYDANGKLVEIISDNRSGDIIKYNLSYNQDKISTIKKYNTGKLSYSQEFFYTNGKLSKIKFYSNTNSFYKEYTYKYSQDSKIIEHVSNRFYGANTDTDITTFEYVSESKVKVTDNDRNTVYYFTIDNNKNPYLNTISLDGLSRFYHNILPIASNIINEESFDLKGAKLNTTKYNNTYDADGFLVKQEYLQYAVKTTKNYSYNK